MHQVAALYVQPGGVYYDLPGVEPWGLPERDAREYKGPHPVVAHPPCKRWGQYWWGGPGTTKRFKKGDDGNCFAAALWAVRTFGGVIEHPAKSHAWHWFGLPRPLQSGQWTGGGAGGFSCCVEQGHYGHRARKPTWLYVVGQQTFPQLRWGPSVTETDCQHLCGKDRAATPPAFRDVLLDIARSSCIK